MSSDEARAAHAADRIRALQAQINALHAEQLHEVAVLDHAWARIVGIHYPDAARDEIAIGLRLTETQAQHRLETARALEQRLPHTRELGLAGRLSLEHLHAMAGRHRRPRPGPGSQVEIRVLDDERAIRPGQLAFRARAAAQELTGPTDERRAAQQPQRSLQAWRDPWGQVGFSLSVPEPDAAVIDTYLAATASRQGPDDLRPVDERRADALLELIRSALDSGTLPSGGDGRRPHVDLTTTLEGLREGAWHAATIGGKFVLSGQLRELACDADVRTTVLDRDRYVVDQGRTTRVVSARLRGRLALRDQHCRFPGCDVRPPRCRAHHIRHWADGGPTDLGTCSSCASDITTRCTKACGRSGSRKTTRPGSARSAE